MFKKWLAIFKKNTLIDRAYQRSFEMLAITMAMCMEAKVSLRQREDSEIDLSMKEKPATSTVTAGFPAQVRL